jgi:hypothetical protein
MPLNLPTTAQTILAAVDAERLPILDYEVAHKLSGLHRADGLTDPERKGAWAEESAFSFRPAEESSPWGTHYGPIFTATKNDGTPLYAPDIAEIDEEVIAHWERRSGESSHPVLRARYADVAWDLKKRAIGKSADVLFAQRAIDAYLDGITAKLYKEPPMHAVEAGRRALELATTIRDGQRAERSKQVLLDLFDAGVESAHVGIWATLYDALTENKRVALSAGETDRLIRGLEDMLARSATPGGKGFDPWGAEAAARRLASHYERHAQKDQAERALRVYGSAFEGIAEQASPTLAMAWLQPVYDEFNNRGMKADAARVLAAIAAKGNNVAADLKQVRSSFQISEDQLREFVDEMTKGLPHDALLRVAAHFIPKTGEVKALLQEMLTTAPLMARIGVTRIVGDHFAASAGSVEEDPEGRLIMQLAQHIQIQNLFLNRCFEQLRGNGTLTTDAILAVMDESPVFTADRRVLLQEGLAAYINGDHTKAIHVIIPQIEQALRHLLALMGVPTLKPGRKGLLQLKNLNDIFREPAIKEALGDDLRLYLLTFLADQRGHNIRNSVSHGMAAPELFNQGLADQTLHALLAVSLVRQSKRKAEGEMALLFQYGSNCDGERLNSPERLDGAASKPVLAQTVDECDLAFDIWSHGNKCAASDLVPAPGTGRRAFGILYEVPADRIRGEQPKTKRTMAQIEGPCYEEQIVKVTTPDGNVHEAVTFLGKKDARREKLWTTGAYVKHIVDGLRAHDAPPDYVQNIIDTAVATNQRADPPNTEETELLVTMKLPRGES